MKKIIATAALTASMVGGGFVGAAVLGGTAGAQDDTDDPTADTDRPRPDRGAKFEVLAEVLGTDADTLRESLQDGQTLADIAATQGVPVQDVIDEMIAQAEERLDAAVADGRLSETEAAEKSAEIAERVDDVVNGEAPIGRRGPRGPRGPFGDGPPADAPEIQGSVLGDA